MGKKFAVRPVEPLVLEFADGTKKEVALTTEALMILWDEFGDFSKLLEEEMTRPIELASKVLYAGMKVMDATVTLEEAKAIILGGGVQLMAEMFDMLTDSFGELPEAELKKTLMPIMKKMMKNKTGN